MNKKLQQVCEEYRLGEIDKGCTVNSARNRYIGFQAAIKSKQVQGLVEALRKISLEVDYMYEQLGNNVRINKADKKFCSVAEAYQESQKVLKDFEGDSDD